MNDMVTPDAVPTLSAGQRLRQARESAGLHVVALAAVLKVPVRKLEALEGDRYNELPDKTFVRALALSVCRQLKVADTGAILALLPQSDQVRLGEIPTLRTPFKSPDVTLAQKSAGVSLPRPALFAGVVLLLAAVVWFVVPERDPAAVRVTPVAAPHGVSAVAEPAPAGEVPPPAQAAAAGSEPSVTTAPAEPTDGVSAAPAATAALTPVNPAAAAAPAPVAAANAVLHIRAGEVSWVEVIGASGSQLLHREMVAGETVGFSTDAPYKVVIGRADATQVSVRGKALDIAGFARNNVARFEVK